MDDDPSIQLLHSLDLLISRISRARTDVGLEFAAERMLYERERELLTSAVDMTTYRHQVAGDIATTAAEPLAWLDLGLIFGKAVSTKLTSGRFSKLVPLDVRNAHLELGVRAINVGYEVTTLLSAGLRMGAQARWRTLYELAVVSRVLELGNRWTARRFLQHRYVYAAKGIENIPKIASALAEATPSLLARRNDLLRRYGTSFGSPYGWAAELTKRRLGVQTPRFHHLERLADLDDQPVLGHYAHHHVHADSMGNALLYDSGTVHHGATHWDDDSTAVATATLNCTIQIALSALRVWDRYTQDSVRFMHGAISLAEEIRFVGIRNINYGWRRVGQDAS